MPVQFFDHLPAGLVDIPASGLLDFLGAPTVFEIPGELAPPVFLSVLLHGNETSGWEAVRRILGRHQKLRRKVILFIANVEAAAANQRTLQHQQDFNRVWRDGTGPDGEMAEAVRGWLNRRPLFAAVDLHNNTGRNPHYSVLMELAAKDLGLAQMFSDQAIVVQRPNTVLSRMFVDWCPTLTLELGPMGDPRCVDRGENYVKRLLQLDTVPTGKIEDLCVFQTVARVYLPEDVSFRFADNLDHQPADSAAQQPAQADLTLTADMEAVNFHTVPAGTEFGCAAPGVRNALQVLNVERRDVTDEFFEHDGPIWSLRQPVIPSMYTTDPRAIRQDCLCYFMEPVASGHESRSDAS